MNLPKKIVTAREIGLKKLKEKNYELIEDTEVIIRNCSFELFAIQRGWNYILNMKEFSKETVINFYKQYLDEIEFNLLTDKEKKRLWANLPNKEFFESRNCPRDILDKMDKAFKDYEVLSYDYREMNKVINLYLDIIDYIEILISEHKIPMLDDKWQGEKTRIVISDWEEIDQLFDKNFVFQNENIEQKTIDAWEKVKKELEPIKNIDYKIVCCALEIYKAKIYNKDFEKERVIEKLRYDFNCSMDSIRKYVSKKSIIDIETRYNLPKLHHIIITKKEH